MNRPIPCFMVPSLLALVMACGGEPSGPTPGGNRLTAVIDGENYTAPISTIEAGVVPAGSPGRLSFIGGKNEIDGDPGQLSIALGFVDAPGTYPAGVEPFTTQGARIVFFHRNEFWATNLDPMAGSVTITSLGNGRVTGTFSATLSAVLVPASGTIELTNGRFDVPLSAAYAPPEGDNYGSSFEMTFGGEPWSAAVAIGTGGGTSSIVLELTAFNGGVGVILEDVTSPGTYAINIGPGPRRMVSAALAPAGWGGTASDNGTITISALSGTRIAGTISATLGSSGGPPTTRQMQASFDVRTIPNLFPP